MALIRLQPSSDPDPLNLESALEVENATALVAGGTGGIGLALVRELLGLPNIRRVYASWRSEARAEALNDLVRAFPDRLRPIRADCSDSQGVAQIAQTIREDSNRLHVAINCVGFLHQGDQQPEKSLSQVDPDAVLESFRVNTVPTLMLAKELQPLFRHKEPALFAAVSARVGSIEDNRLGGWYSYRASKAALNMVLRTIAVEFRRTCRSTCVVALHPGTTDTPLSQPFQKNVPPEKLFTPEFCAERLVSVMQGLTAQNTGCFYAWDGSEIPW